MNTNEPISNAQVEVGYYRDLWNGCNYHNTYETNEEGYVSADDLKAKYICDIVVKKMDILITELMMNTLITQCILQIKKYI